jgi:hypothetical protein
MVVLGWRKALSFDYPRVRNKYRGEKIKIFDV